MNPKLKFIPFVFSIFFAGSLFFPFESYAHPEGRKHFRESSEFSRRHHPTFPEHRWYPGPRQPPPPPYHSGWFYGSTWDGGKFRKPDWLFWGLTFPLFRWVTGTLPYGQWQCISFTVDPYTRQLWSFWGIGPTMDQAAYQALYACGGPFFVANGCYIPPAYCQWNYY